MSRQYLVFELHTDTEAPGPMRVAVIETEEPIDAGDVAWCRIPDVEALIVTDIAIDAMARGTLS